jgi:hypothetical protein
MNNNLNNQRNLEKLDNLNNKKNLEKLDDRERTECEIWTRVMGYHRDVKAFNKGKRSEFGERKPFVQPFTGRDARVD